MTATRKKLTTALVCDNEICAPDYFDVRLMTTPEQRLAFVERAAMFVQAMADLGRVVILHYIEDERKLYLSSIEETAP